MPPDAVPIRVDESHGLERTVARLRDHRSGRAWREERRLSDVERAQARQGRKERRRGERRVEAELVRREGHIR